MSRPTPTPSTTDETVRCLLASIVGDVAHFPAVTLGHLIGSLDATEAALFAQRCTLFVDPDVTVPSRVDEATEQVVFDFAEVAA